MKEFAVFLDNSSKVPIYEQIYKNLKENIATGKIKPGEKLPSSREFSEYLQVSRSTILLAYDQLAAEGYIDAVPQKGYFANELDKNFESKEEVTLDFASDKAGDSQYKIDFSPNGIETANFPFNEWKKISKQIFSVDMQELFNSGDVKGDYGLRKKLAEFLSKSRGVKATPDRIILGSGNETLLTIINAILPDSTYAVENPAYMKSYNILKNMTGRVVPIELDKDGISVELLAKSNADIAYVTPSHQYPLGIVMGIKRRTELLNWAYKDEKRYIIEDDYDSEFRYKGKPVPSLQSIDTEGKVIYMGTFSKSVSPAVRMNYMVLPEKLCEAFNKKAKLFSNTVSRIDQKYLEIFMENGGFERHLNKMRTIYKGKHAAILSGLKSWKNIEISGENAGAHVLVKIKNGMDEKQNLEAAKKNGIKVYSLSDYYIGEKKNKDVVMIIGYARLNIKQIEDGLKELKNAWKV